MPTTGPNSMPMAALHRKPKPMRRLGGSLMVRPSRSSVMLMAMSRAVTAMQRVLFSSCSERTKIFCFLDIEKDTSIINSSVATAI